MRLRCFCYLAQCSEARAKLVDKELGLDTASIDVRRAMDPLEKIGKCRVPVFIAHGTADRLVPFALGERLFQAAHEPRCFYRLDGDDHNSPLPAEMFTALKQFLDKSEH